MNRKNILRTLLLGFGLLGLQACDKDFNSIGDGVIGEPNFDIETYSVSDIISYNQPTGETSPQNVETSNLSEITLGVYNDPVFGQTTTSFVSAVNFTPLPTEFGNNLKVDSVYLYIPYFSEIEKYDDDNKPVYKLKNAYGSGSFDLKIYQNGYYLFDPAIGGTQESNPFYSDDKSLFENVKIGPILNDARTASQNRSFLVSNQEIVIHKRDSDGNIVQEGEGDNKKDAVLERFAPGLWTDLNKEYFQSTFFENRSQIEDASSFRNYFRGLYFDVTANESQGTAIQLDFSKAKLVLRYSQDKKEQKEGEDIKREHKTIEYALGTNSPKVSFFENEFTPNYLESLANANKTEGDERVFIKGGNGSLGIIQLFSTNDFEELKALKEKDLLINEVILTMYVDQESLTPNSVEPQRLYLYNIDEQRVIADYTLDGTTNSNATYFKALFGGILEKEDKKEEGKGIRYRFKITEHVRSLLNNKKTNYSPKLALVAANNYTTDVAVLNYKKLKEEISNTPDPIKAIPALGVISNLGTVIHGANSKVDGKKMKIDIFYTKTKN